MRVSVYSVLTVCLLVCLLVVSAKKKKKNKEGQAPRWKEGAKSPEDSYQSAYEGRNLKLDCAVRGRPKPKVSWFKDGTKIKSSDAIKIKKHTLTFKSLSVSDRGNYTCMAKNDRGRLEFTYNVDVTVQIWPLEVEGPMNLTVLEGETVKFRCRVLNDPKATISWLKRSQDDDTDSGSNSLDKKPEFLENSGPDQEVLVLPNVTAKDSGKYACLAGNLWGIKYNNAWLAVVPTGNSPSIVLEPKTPEPSTTTTSTTTTTATTTTTTTTPSTTTTLRTTMRYWRTVTTSQPRTSTFRPFFWTEHTMTERPRITYPPILAWPTMEPPATKRPKHRKNGRRRNKDRRKHKKNKHMESTTEEQSTYPQDIYSIPTKDVGHRSHDRNPHSPVNRDDNRNPIVKEEEVMAGNKTSQEMEQPPRKGDIGLWTIYTIVGAIAGVILLLGLIAITVALCCRRDSNGLYKSTPV